MTTGGKALSHRKGGRKYWLSLGQIVVSSLQVIEDQLLSNHGKRGQVIHVLRNQSGRSIKLFESFIEAFNFL